MNGDTHDGKDGVFFFEVVEDLIVRQIVEVDGAIYWSTEDFEADQDYPITDQPEFSEDEESKIPLQFNSVRISADEFEVVWMRGGGPPRFSSGSNVDTGSST